ncbi:MAG: DUF1893 domain-containing protein [Acutalibacteraceae bacterium]
MDTYNNDLSRAKALLRNNNYTFAAVCGDKTITSRERGVKPLLEILDSDNDLHGYSAADKVIGKGAAFLYVLLDVSAVYAGVISKPALDVLQSGGIYVEYLAKSEHIINRKGDGICPIEQAVTDIENASAALPVIRQTLKKLQISNKSDKNA